MMNLKRRCLIRKEIKKKMKITKGMMLINRLNINLHYKTQLTKKKRKGKKNNNLLLVNK